MSTENEFDVKTAFEGLNKGFEEFKSANDERLKEVENKGASDPLLSDKIAKIEADMVKSEAYNQSLVLQKAQAEKQEALQKQMDEIATVLNRSGGAMGADAEMKADDEYKTAFAEFCRKTDMLEDTKKILLDRKALAAGVANQGAEYVTPAALEGTINKDIIEMSPIRALASVTQIGTSSYLIAKRTGVAAATWVGETDARTESTGYATGQDEITAHELTAEYYASNMMLEDSAFSVESEFGLEFAEQFAVAEGIAFINGTGSGSNQPAGFLTAGLATGNSGIADNISADGVIELYYGLKTGYAQRGIFGLNRLTLSEVRKLKATDGHYLWAPGVAVGQPNTIIGAAYAEIPDMPDVGAGTTPMVFADWARGYRIVDRVGMSVMRDPYTRASTGQVKFLARKRVGGLTIRAEAMRTLTCAA